MRKEEIKIFNNDVHNILNAEVIPSDAFQDSKNWITQDGVVKLVNGKESVGPSGDLGSVKGLHFGYKVDGTTVLWRKVGTVIQYFNGTAWVDVVTGLSDVDYVFSNYSSLSGTFTFAFGPDGIYKFHNANPESFCAMYDEAKNFKGYAFIDRGRTILWNRTNDKTGIYGSYIDNQRGISGSTGVYTSVAAEAIGALGSTNYTGTLAFKASGATRNCFAVTFTDGTETFTDNYDGTLTGSAGGTGTINYITGDYDITFNATTAGAVTSDYQWEDSNIRGVTDFSKSNPRQAGEGFQFPQDEGGDAIKTVLIGSDGAYYSMKSNSIYYLSLDADDTGATNEVYRKDLGVPTLRGGISTGGGIVFMNTSRPEKPIFTMLQKNKLGDTLDVYQMFEHFDFSNYVYDDLTMDSYDRYIIISCKTKGAVNNDTILLCNIQEKTVSITRYFGRVFARNSGLLYMGSSISQSVYNLFSGFDDDGNTIDNYVISKDESWGTDRLKKTRFLQLKGRISRDQSYEVYANYDNEGFQLLGTVVGTGSYVDSGAPQTIGSNLIGGVQIGGGDGVTIYPYFLQIKIKKPPKFRVRSLKFVAKKIGYVDINYQKDLDLLFYEQKMPSRYRQKQNVSLDGESVDVDSPEY